MKITAISVQAKNKNRVNIFVDGKYRFSLDIHQVSELGIRVSKDYTEEEVVELESESEFGKLYTRALEYCVSRPHSVKELRDYLWRKTQMRPVRSRTTGEIYQKKGVSPAIAERVLERVQTKGYVNDESFARWWVENRNQKKGVSARKLQAELASKGVDREIIQSALTESQRNDGEELHKIITKKRHKYSNEKLIAYLARQGFSYEDITSALRTEE